MHAELPALTLFFGVVQRSYFYQTLLDAGLAVGLIKDTSNPHFDEDPAGFRLIAPVDFRQGPSAIASAVNEIRRSWVVECVLNVDEEQVPVWADVCRRLGLRSMNARAAVAVRSKSVMRRRFSEVLGPDSTGGSEVAATLDDARRLAGQMGFPVVLKPGNLQGSFFVTLCHNPGELATSWERMRYAIAPLAARAEATGIPTEILVERYLEGSTHSVECLVMDGRVWSTPVIDVVTGADLGAADFHHFARTTATCLSAAQQAAARTLAERAALALDVDRGVLHVELVYTTDGPCLIEAGGRPGANRPWLLQRAFGIDLMGAYRDVMRGQAPNLAPLWEAAAAYVTPFADRRGTFQEIRGLPEITCLPSYAEHTVVAHRGETVQPRHCGAMSAAMRIELVHAMPGQVLSDIWRITELRPQMFVVT